VENGESIQAEIEERRRRRREEKRKRIRRRRIVALAVLAALLALIVLTGFVLAGGGSKGAETTSTTTAKAAKRAVPANLHPVQVPKEIRGVHVTMALASLKGKMAEYYALKRQGLNTIELDVKDENGEVGFVPSPGRRTAAGST